MKQQRPWLRNRNIPLKVIRAWIPMVPVWAKRADISWRVMYKSVSNHLVFAFETFPPFTPGAASDRTIMRAGR
jgi:hypothetical protein